MNIVDFTHLPSQAFATGFMKGMAAPVMLFANFPMPVIDVQVSVVEAPKHSGNAWEAVGDDMRKVFAEQLDSDDS